MKENELLFRLAQKIKQLRQAKGLTLRDLEALADIENSNLARLESGAVNPRLTTLYKLSRAFGIPLSQLLDIE